MSQSTFKEYSQYQSMDTEQYGVFFTDCACASGGVREGEVSRNKLKIVMFRIS